MNMDAVSGVTVKICGVRRPEDAIVAAEAGANYVGIVLVPGRRRRVEAAAARRITDALRGLGPDAPRSVGLFGDQPLAEVLETIAVARIDVAQLCGQETVQYCQTVLNHAEVIKALHVANDANITDLSDRLDAYTAPGCIVTLDSQVPGLHGGTGQSFDWSVAAELAAGGRRFLLAGGLTPENVAEAVAVARPWGVDVSTGVETDGAKDATKIRRFVTNARLHPYPIEV